MVLPLDFEIAETEFATEDLLTTEELLFPKLDGILFPIVVENADVVAPCAWMGGAEVTLTAALNNYYQPMTEENADEVIADAYEFLANRVVDEGDDEPLEPEAKMPLEERQTSDEKQTDTPFADAPEAKVQIEQTAEVVMREPQQLQRSETDLPEAPQNKYADAPTQKPPQDVARHVIAEDIPRIEPPLVKEIDETADEGMPDIVGKSDMPEITVVTEGQVDTTDDSLVPFVEAEDSIAEPVVAAEVQEADLEQGEAEVMDDEPIIFVTTESPISEDSDEQAEDAEAEIIETEMPLQAESTVEVINELLADLSQASEDEGYDMQDEAGRFVDAIAELSLGVELEDDEEPMDGDEIKNELQNLYARLLEHAVPTTNRKDFAALLATLTVELGANGEDEPDSEQGRRSAQKRVKALRTVVQAMKQALSRVIAMGRSALRLHIVNAAEGHTTAAQHYTFSS